MKRILFALLSFSCVFALLVPTSACLNKEGLPVYTIDESNTLTALTLKRARGEMLTPDEQLRYDSLVRKGIEEGKGGIDFDAILRTLGTIGGSVLGSVLFVNRQRGPAKPMDPITSSTLLDVAAAVRSGTLPLKSTSA